MIVVVAHVLTLSQVWDLVFLLLQIDEPAVHFLLREPQEKIIAKIILQFEGVNPRPGLV